MNIYTGKLPLKMASKSVNATTIAILKGIKLRESIVPVFKAASPPDKVELL